MVEGSKNKVKQIRKESHNRPTLIITVPTTVLNEGTAMTWDGYDKMTNISIQTCYLYIRATSTNPFIY